MNRTLLIGCMALVAGSVTACARGAINSQNPLRLEAGSAAKSGTAPLREMQVDLPKILRAGLEGRDRDPKVDKLARITRPDRNDRDRPPGGFKSRGLAAKLDEKDRDPDDGLEELILAVDLSGDESVRNSTVATLVAASTSNCSIYLMGLRSGQVTSRLTADITATLFSITSSLIQPASTAKGLAGLSAFATSTGASIDRSVFAQQGAELIADAIVQLREEDRRSLERKMSLDLAEWPMGLALADFNKFHGDCSMLRGLSRMREAVTARDQEVRATRLSAAAVARSGGSGAEVAAAITGVSDAFGDAGDNNNAPQGAASPGRTMDADLQLMRIRALDCFVTAQDQLESAALGSAISELPAFKGNGKCSTKTSEWGRRYSSLAGTTIVAINLPDAKLATAMTDQKALVTEQTASETALTTAVAAVTATEAIADEAAKIAALEKANTAKTAAEARKTAAVAAVKKGEIEIAELTKKRREDILKIIGAQRDVVAKRIDADIRRVSGARTSAGLAIKDLGPGQTAADVVKILRIVAGADLADADPAFLVAIAAAEKIATLPDLKDNAALAATMARNAQRDYVDTFKL